MTCMAEYATRDEVQEIVNKAVEDLSVIIRELAQSMHEEITEVKSSIDRLTNTIDGFVKRLDEVETEQLARDRQFERLVEWARKVSEKTGIPLENL